MWDKNHKKSELYTQGVWIKRSNRGAQRTSKTLVILYS